MVCKIHALSKGFSGISLDVVERLILMLEKDIIPVVPEQGSVGASGDLAPLSHLVLPLLGLGKVWENDKIRFLGAGKQIDWANGIAKIKKTSDG